MKKLLAILWLGCLTALGADGDITGASVDTNGFFLTVYMTSAGAANTNGSFLNGFGERNILTGSEKLKMVVDSPGYDSTGATNVQTRTLYGTVAARKAYPSHIYKETANVANVLSVKVALSDYVFSGDVISSVTTLAGFYATNSFSGAAATTTTVTNTSTSAHPLALMQWDTVAGVRAADRVKNDFVVAVNADHRYGIAAVRFDATGQTSGATTNFYVTSETWNLRSATANWVPAFQATIPISIFTQGELIDLRVRVYPVIGDSTTILDTDSFTTATEEVKGFNKATILCDKSNALDVAKYVATTGNDTTGDGSSGNPYATVAKAMTAGNIVYLQAGAHGITGSTQTRKVSSEWVVAQPAPGESSATVSVQIKATTTAFRCSRMMFQNLTVTIASTSSSTDGEELGNFLRFKNCVFDHSGVAIAGGTFYRCYAVYFEGATGDLGYLWSLTGFSTTRAGYQLDGCIIGSGAGTMTSIHRLVGCYGSVNFSWADPSTSNIGPMTDGHLIWFNTLYKFAAAGTSMQLCHTRSISRGLSIRGNVFEKITGTSPTWEIGGGGTAGAGETTNVIIENNTTAGQRMNVAFAYITNKNHTLWRVKGNVFGDAASVGSGFTAITDNTSEGTPYGGKFGNWSFVYGVGWEHNFFCTTIYTNESFGLNYVMGGQPGFVHDKSFNTTSSGDGNYMLISGSTSAFPKGYSNDLYDITGNMRSPFDVPGALSLRWKLPPMRQPFRRIGRF